MTDRLGTRGRFPGSILPALLIAALFGTSAEDAMCIITGVYYE